jgi:hypothetical protein
MFLLLTECVLVFWRQQRPRGGFALLKRQGRNEGKQTFACVSGQNPDTAMLHPPNPSQKAKPRQTHLEDARTACHHEGTPSPAQVHHKVAQPPTLHSDMSCCNRRTRQEWSCNPLTCSKMPRNPVKLVHYHIILIKIAARFQAVQQELAATAGDTCMEILNHMCIGLVCYQVVQRSHVTPQATDAACTIHMLQKLPHHECTEDGVTMRGSSSGSAKLSAEVIQKAPAEPAPRRLDRAHHGCTLRCSSPTNSPDKPVIVRVKTRKTLISAVC